LSAKTALPSLWSCMSQDLCKCWWKERTLISGSTWMCGVKEHHLWSWCNGVWRDARGVLCRQGWTTGEPSSLCKSMELCNNNSRGMVHTGREEATGWDVWRSAHGGESQTMYKYELGMCVGVFITWHSKVNQLNNGWMCFLHFQFLLQLFSCFVFSKSLTYTVNLFCYFLSHKC
jgi:hypothetical protein